VGKVPADYLEFAAACTGRLHRTACLLTGDWHLAEDLVQETLAKLYAVWRRLDRSDAPVTYAQTVLLRTFLSQRRKRSSTEWPSAELPETADPDHDATLRLTLLEGLAQLSLRDRAVLVLRYWDDRSVEETAHLLDMSPGSVRTRSLRALQRLRSVLGDHLSDLAAH
jgi:RNA polymerase sigma-70 factor (sigma-E family)